MRELRHLFGLVFNGELTQAPKPPGLRLDEFVLQIDDTMTTKNGRLLNELSASGQAIALAKARGISMGTIRSTLPDSPSRDGKTIHIDALKEMRRGWQDVLNGLGWINSNVFLEDPPEEIPVSFAQGLAGIGFSLPFYLMNRVENPYGPQGELPDVVGDIFKTTNGIYAVVNGFEAKRDGVDIVISDAQQVYAAAEEKNKFRSKRYPDRACPAPKAMIVQAVDALFFRKGANPSESELQTVIPDYDGLVRFSYYFLRLHSLKLGLEKNLTKIGKGLIEAQQTGDKAKTTEHSIQLSRLILSNSVEQTKIQVGLNQAVGRDTNIAPVTTQDIETQIANLQQQ